MTQITSAFSSLLPLAGAVALTVQGIRRKRRAPARADNEPVQQPIEPPRPAAKAPRAPRPDAACTQCGTAIPFGQTQCAACRRAEAGAVNSAGATALHWLFFVVVMSAIIGAGWLVAP